MVIWVCARSLSHVWLIATPWTLAPGCSVHGILQARNTGVGSHSLLQGSNPGLLRCRWILYCLSYQGIQDNKMSIPSLELRWCLSLSAGEKMGGGERPREHSGYCPRGLLPAFQSLPEFPSLGEDFCSENPKRWRQHSPGLLCDLGHIKNKKNKKLWACVLNKIKEED